jgi:hypothetical protein
MVELAFAPIFTLLAGKPFPLPPSVVGMALPASPTPAKVDV